MGRSKQELNTNRYPIASCNFLLNGKNIQKKYEKGINSNIILREEKINQSTRKFFKFACHQNINGLFGKTEELLTSLL
jgi:hypothetical protein